MSHTKQKSFFKTNWKHHLCHGGILRQKRAGRGQRPLSTKEPLHLVFKVNRERLRHGTLRSGIGHTLILQIVRRYAKKFFVTVEQISIQGDHCHLLIRTPRRAKFHAFFRVVAGQIAQRFQLEGLLKPNVTDTPAGPRKGKPERSTSASRESREEVSTSSFHESQGVRSAAECRRRYQRGSDSELRTGLKEHESTAQKKSPHEKRNLHAEAVIAAAQNSDPCKTKSPITPPLSPPGTKLWKHRPFSRVVRGYRAYQVVRDYVQLNELEAQGRIPYRKERLRGLSSEDWEILWA